MKLNIKSSKLLKMEDFDKICRCCVSEGNLISIFELEYEEKVFSEVMTHLFNAQVNDNDDRPKNICEDCFNEIIQFYDFKKMYDTSRALIETIISHTYSVSASTNKITKNQVQISGNEKAPSKDAIEITSEDSEYNIIFENPPEFLTKNSKVPDNHEESILENKCKIQEFDANTKEANSAKYSSDENYCHEDGSDHNENDFSEKKLFSKRKNNSYSKKSKDECTVCSAKITKHNLKRHMRVHTGEKPHVCDVCGKSYTQSTTLKEHQRLHTGEKPYLCAYCGKTFRKNLKYRIHLRTHGEKGKHIDKAFKAVSCEICDKIFSDRSSLSAHLLRHGEKKFLCSHCGKAFFSKAALESHSIAHTGVKPFSCKFCDRPFSRLHAMKIHMLIHTGQRPYTCKICSKSFTQSHHLKSHLRTHSGERPYTCPHCNKTYPQSATLKIHIRTHTGETPYTCDKCSKAFHDPSALKRHKKTHVLTESDVTDNAVN